VSSGWRRESGAHGEAGGHRQASDPGAHHRDGDDIEPPAGPLARGLEERWRPDASRLVADYQTFRVRQDRIRHPDDGAELHYHAVEVPPGVMVVPVTGDGSVVMVEQYRHAVRRVCLEFPAGMLDGDESPEEAGPRELMEETGYEASSLIRLATLDPDPSLQSNSTCVLLAQGCRPTGRRQQDHGEDVRLRIVRENAVQDLISQGVVRHAVAVAAWGLYERWRAMASAE
jgi:8-oxo-dGTP pyrophosphatase MutT (NUDIX family)